MESVGGCCVGRIPDDKTIDVTVTEEQLTSREGRQDAGHGSGSAPPWGEEIEPRSKSLEDTDFTLACSMNLRRPSEASMRIDAAATQPVFGVLCHQVVPFAEYLENAEFPTICRTVSSWAAPL